MGVTHPLPFRYPSIPASAKAGIFLVATLCACTRAAILHAQTAVNVQVALDKPVNVMTTESMGVYTDVYDSNTINPKVAAYLHAAGMYTIQFPAGYGSYADLYHWSTGGGTKYENFAKQDHFYPGEANMAHMVPFIDKLGTALLTVNYGSNDAGTGGGEPAAAAAWVAYMNGDPASTQPIGKDSTGQDWKTVGYWASLRATAPLASDDGLNQLRANHPKPLSIEFWQIGSEVYNNGFYGGDHKAEEDLHAPYPANEADNEKRRRNPNLSPAFYGARLNDFSKAMKAVDPKVKIGATLNLVPIDSSWGPDWNTEVLKAACANIDFESFVWRPDFRNGPDYQTRDEAGILSSPEQQIGQFLSEALYADKKSCPAGHQPRVAVTQMAPIHWPKVIPSKLTDALFAADAMALLIETGTINTDWNELHDGYFMNESSEPGPAFFGIQMLHIIAFRPGDEFVTATTGNPIVAVHAVRRANGTFGVILINKDQNTPAEVKVNVSGGSLAATGTRFDYGPTNFKANAPVSQSKFTSGGNTFTVTVPPYTITDIVLPKAP
jgi:hypothetical protein